MKTKSKPLNIAGIALLAAVLAGGLLTRPQGPEALGTVR